MSNKVVEDLVLPVVMWLLQEEYGVEHRDRYHTTVVRDERLIEFFARQLVRRLSIAGEPGGQCKFMDEILRELMERDYDAFVELVRSILKLYINLRKSTAMQGIAEKKEREAPPNPYFVKKQKKKKQRKPTEVVPVV